MPFIVKTAWTKAPVVAQAQRAEFSLSLSLSYKFQLLSWINFAPNKIEEIEVIFS